MNKPALSFGLAPQPDVLRALAAKPSFRGRGLLGRFLYALPHHNIGGRSLDTQTISGAVRADYSGTLTAVINHPWNADAKGRATAHILKLTPGAYAAWAELWDRIEHDMPDGGALEHVRTWAGKLPGALARIAGLLHVGLHAFRKPWEIDISEETMRTVLSLAEPYRAYALMAVDELGRKPDLDDARKVLEWIKQTGKREFSFRDCHQAHRSRFPLAEDLKPAIAVLEERGFIRQRDALPVPHRPSKMYEVNPHAL